MDWVYNFFNAKKPTKFMGAGCLFTNKHHVLAGYQPSKKMPYISGIGGLCNEGEDYIVTAIREMLEELFMIYPTPELINNIQTIVKYRHVLINGSYINYVYSFEDLEDIMNYLGISNTSMLYNVFPKTISELILNRLEYDSELTTLVLLPCQKNIIISNELIQDINMISL